MKKNTIISWVVSALTFTFLMACADESPVNPLEEEIKADYSSSSSCTSIIDCADAASRPPGYSSSSEKYSSSSYYYGNSYYSSSSSKKYSSSSYVSESEKCRLGTSSKSDSYCCSYYEYQCGIAESKTMVFTLTHYEQITSGWDGLQNAGDPEVYFNIYTYSEGDSAQTLETGVMLNRSDLTYWTGEITTTLKLIQGVDSIQVCPHITDEDMSIHDDYSSGYCYSINKVGTIKDYDDVIEQSDYKNTKASLEWEWYLY